MLVRPCQPDDLPAVYEVIRAASAAEWTHRITQAALRTMKDPAQEAVVAILQNQVVGFAWWSLDRLPLLPFQGWVHPAERRQGVGTALLVRSV